MGRGVYHNTGFLFLSFGRNDGRIVMQFQIFASERLFGHFVRFCVNWP